MRVHTIIRIQIEDILLSPGKGTQYCTIVIFEKSSSFGDTGTPQFSDTAPPRFSDTGAGLTETDIMYTCIDIIDKIQGTFKFRFAPSGTGSNSDISSILNIGKIYE